MPYTPPRQTPTLYDIARYGGYSNPHRPWQTAQPVPPGGVPPGPASDAPPDAPPSAPPSNNYGPWASGYGEPPGGVNPSTGQEANTAAWRDQMRNEARTRAARGTQHGVRDDDYGGDTKARTSVKNTFMAIARDYDATPEGLRNLVNDPRFQRAFPNAKLVDHPTGDKIDFGGTLSDFESGDPVGVVDVGLSFDGQANSGRGWWWGPSGGSTARASTPGTSPATPGGPPTQTPPGSPALDTGSRGALVSPYDEPTLYDLGFLYQGQQF